MAAVTSAVIGVGTAAYTIANAEKRKKEARRELSDYERQTLNNAFEEMAISTEGLDLMRDDNAAATAGAVEAARGAGTRGIIGALPGIVGASNDVNAETARYLDDLNNRRNYAIAGDNARIEGITENRDTQNINALSSQIISANQDRWNGIMGLGSSIAAGSRALNREAPVNPTVEPINANPAGIVPMGAPAINTQLGGFSSPYSMPAASPYSGNDIYGEMFQNDDMINKYY